MDLVQQAKPGTPVAGVAQEGLVRTRMKVHRPQRRIEHADKTGFRQPVPKFAIGVITAGEGLGPEANPEAMIPPHRDVAKP
jgi:hypothetical protein